MFCANGRHFHHERPRLTSICESQNFQNRAFPGPGRYSWWPMSCASSAAANFGFRFGNLGQRVRAARRQRKGTVVFRPVAFARATKERRSLLSRRPSRRAKHRFQLAEQFALWFLQESGGGRNPERAAKASREGEQLGIAQRVLHRPQTAHRKTRDGVRLAFGDGRIVSVHIGDQILYDHIFKSGIRVPSRCSRTRYRPLPA